MGVSNSAAQVRRNRYIRASDRAPSALTPTLSTVLSLVGEFGILTSNQLMQLMERSQKVVNQTCRAGFDAGLLNVLPIPRAALADPGEKLTAGHIFGSAPNVFTLTLQGLRLLREMDGGEEVSIPTLGPKSALFFLSHRLMVSDVRIFFTRCARATEDHDLVRWQEGSEAEIQLSGTISPKVVRPDAWFRYQVSSQAMTAFVEADRGSEKGLNRWLDKIAAYDRLFGSPRLKEVTGFNRARLLVVAITQSRREHLAEVLHTHARSELQERIWLADQSVLVTPDLTRAVWQQPGSRLLKPLISRPAKTGGG